MKELHMEEVEKQKLEHQEIHNFSFLETKSKTRDRHRARFGNTGVHKIIRFACVRDFSVFRNQTRAP